MSREQAKTIVRSVAQDGNATAAIKTLRANGYLEAEAQALVNQLRGNPIRFGPKPYTTLSEAQAAHSAKGIPIESTAPVPIPKGTAGKPTNYSGDKAGLTYEWTEGGYKYTARLHEATPGAPPGSPISWVVERAKPGQAGSKKLGIPQVDRVEQVLVPDGAGGTKWLSRGDWEKLKQGHTAGTLTPAEQQLLKGGHFDVPPQ